MLNRFIHGGALAVLREMPDESVHCCVTSPPYWGLRDYGVDDQIGLEATPEEYVAKLVDVFREVRRVLRSDGTLWLNLGDSYSSGGGSGWQGKHGARFDRTHTQRALLNHASSGLEPKNLIGIPWRVAFALQADGWWLRSDIIWNKPNVLPESVLDRPTGAHEYIFLMAKSDRYYYDSTAIREPDSGQEHKHTIVNGAPSLEPSGGIKPVHKGLWGTGERNGAGRNKRSVWTVPTQPFAGAHFATFPRDLVLPCVLAGCPEGGVVLDPFAGAGTTALVAKENGRHWIGIELKADYIALAEQRTSQEVLFGAPE